MAVVCTLSSLLFMTFREMYGFSYTLLGLLVVMNFSTQLLIDLIFTFFTKYFNIHKTVRVTPFLTFCGLLIYGILPSVFPRMAYLWIVIGTVIFSIAAGLNEVLLSPVIAAIPSDNPEREMSKLHSMYAWGVVVVVVVSTIFLKIFGSHSWKYLAILWALVPLVAFFQLWRAELPDMEMNPEAGGNISIMNKGILLCLGGIFFGGAAECTMTQWVSGFLESALRIPKLLGDIFGVAMFAVLLGLGRTLYSKRGKNVLNVMLWGMVGAAVCYLVASLSLNPMIGLIACVITGICVAMLWPGAIICVGENFSGAGVAVYALMAAGGDLGASVAPQLVGIISDKISISSLGVELSYLMQMSPEQAGIRAGLLLATVFPMIGVFFLLGLKRHLKSGRKAKP